LSWLKSLWLLNSRELQSIRQELTQDAKSVEDLMLILESSVFAVSASENWLTKVRFLALEKQAGKI
jgi:hypothetical protein